MPTPEVIERVRALQEKLQAEPHPALEPLKQQLDTIAVEPHDAASYNSLSDRLRVAYDKLESDHPSLAAIVQAAMNALNTAGL